MSEYLLYFFLQAINMTLWRNAEVSKNKVIMLIRDSYKYLSGGVKLINAPAPLSFLESNVSISIFPIYFVATIDEFVTIDLSQLSLIKIQT